MTESDRYLHELRTMLSRRRRRRIIAELRGHLDEGIAAEMAQGLERGEAERRAIARLGSPHRLAAQFHAGAGEDATVEPAMTPLVVVDAEGRELGRCSIESRAEILRPGRRDPGHSVDLGPVGYFRILDVRNGDPLVLVAEPAERPEWRYELVIRKDGIDQRRAFLGGECPYSVGERLKWPPERGQTPVEHQVIAIRPAADDRRTAIIIERVA